MPEEWSGRTNTALQFNKDEFNSAAIGLYGAQIAGNSLFRDYATLLNKGSIAGNDLTQLAYLPISFFKTHKVRTGEWEAEAHFESSGTTGADTSRHYVKSLAEYEASIHSGFMQFYGPPAQYAVLALLPSYLERQHASLVHMAQYLMTESKHPANGFYLNEWEKLAETLQAMEQVRQPTLLIGVTFALLDVAAVYPMRLQHTIIMETGGMKGRRKELTRDEVHQYLKAQWQLPASHSEYGMTELLSQAYARQDGIFYPAATMKVLVRDTTDPLTVTETGTGFLNIIDLSNRHSCAFIATEDIGTVFPDGSFTVTGRADHSMLRGCSMLSA